MDNRILYAILNNDQQVRAMNFLGVFPIDLIPISSLTNSDCCLVVNTKPHHHPGEHWVAVVKSAYGNGIYFDSYGNPPYNLEEVGLILDTCKEWTYNKTRLQSSYTTVCGQYCIFFLTHIARGYSLDQITHLLNEGDSCTNDALIYTYINEKYPLEEVKKLEVVDFPFIFKQYSTTNNI